MSQISQQIAQEINVQPHQVDAAIQLLDEGSTVPFIARYRKEATNGLDDTHLRHLEQRLGYLRELNERKGVILSNIEAQGKLTDQLRCAINEADNKTSLEDLYLPYKPKRRTKGQMAIEAGLEPLANALFEDWQLTPDVEAQAYLNKEAGYDDVKAVLDGASFILIERFAEDATLLKKLRRHLNKQAHLTSRVVSGKEQEGKKFSDYFEHNELLKNIPSHRALAMFRGRNEGFLQLSLDVDPSEEGRSVSSAEDLIMSHYNLSFTSQPAAGFLAKVVRWAWKVKLGLSLENELLGTLREKAEEEAIKVFATNLSDLLMAAPAGAKTTLAIDPGLRTGCKIAVIDPTGKLLATTTIFPHAPQNQWDKSVRSLANLCRLHKVNLIAIGNGTASRESDKLAGEVISQIEDDKPTKLIVSEAGASVYSASEFAANEFPELDVSLRGAVSIGRRLQDPLAELVKIDPKAIGVGQYQHDVSQSQLSKTLDDIVEDCVNAVGVELNSASVPLLSRVSGLTKTMAQNIVKYRDENGRFNNRNELKKVARLGPKAFEQSAGFLRILDGENPLDRSGVHPETYGVVESIISKTGSQLNDLLGNSVALRQVNPTEYTSDEFGEVTVRDIIKELDKPGRDPRPEFKTAEFKDGVNTMNDLEIGMILEGVVSNVANFGAFVDIGVHQDGLVHISSITDKFISDPRDVIKTGDIVKVKVLEVDVDRKRISLTMKLNEKPATASKHNKSKPSGSHHQKKHKPQRDRQPENSAMGNALAAAFAKAKK